MKIKILLYIKNVNEIKIKLYKKLINYTKKCKMKKKHQNKSNLQNASVNGMNKI